VGTGYGRGLDRNGLSKLTVARQNAIARNANGDSTISIVENLGKNSAGEVPTKDQLFVDPYNYQAQSDLYLAVNEVVKRKPDGVAFDYVRYKRGAGAASVVSNVRYLWIYGASSLQAFRDRAENFQGRETILKSLKNSIPKKQNHSGKVANHLIKKNLRSHIGKKNYGNWMLVTLLLV
jgi:hypothetical protein